MAGERQGGRIREGIAAEEHALAWKPHKEAPSFIQLMQLVFPVVYSHNRVVCSLERQGDPVTRTVWDHACPHSSLDKDVDRTGVKDRFPMPRC